MELENTQNNALAKLPMLKLGGEVIENGNSWVPIPVTASETGPSTATKMTVPSTAEEKMCKKNDVKARRYKCNTNKVFHSTSKAEDVFRVLVLKLIFQLGSSVSLLVPEPL
ncbi:hypothetical protein Tco_0339475 [Tanacetum coccineum]